MRALNVAVQDIPEVGLVACLPPEWSAFAGIGVRQGEPPYGDIDLGDVLGVVTKCERCDGVGEWVEPVITPNGGKEMDTRCDDCDGTGDAPLRFVKVLDVWPIVTMSQACADDAPPMPFVVTRGPGGLGVLAGWPDPAHETLLDLPDAVPGGVALHVEWTDCPTCGGWKNVKGPDGWATAHSVIRCPTCQTPPTVEGDGPIVEVTT